MSWLVMLEAPPPPGGRGGRLVLQNQQTTWSENYVTPNQARSL